MKRKEADTPMDTNAEVGSSDGKKIKVLIDTTELDEVNDQLEKLKEVQDNNKNALSLIKTYGECCNEKWIIDQVVRALLGGKEEVYESWKRSMTCVIDPDGEEENYNS